MRVAYIMETINGASYFNHQSGNTSEGSDVEVEMMPEIVVKGSIKEEKIKV